MPTTSVRALLLVLASALAALTPQIVRGAAAYVISDSNTGYVLEEFQPKKKLQIGSLTKVATALVVLDWASATNADLNQLATVPNVAARLNSQPGVGFAPGDTCSLRDLLYAALMQSDNVAAETLAFHVGRTFTGNPELTPVDRFVQQMNALAKDKGMLRTRFLNAHGLDSLEHSLPYSTAEDLARLAAYAMGNSAFRFYVSQKERKITYNAASGPVAYLLRNTNEMLGTSGVDGIKTGTTARAGQCLMLSASRAPESVQKGDTHYITPRRINIVILGSKDRFGEASSLLGRGWQLYDTWAAAGRPLKAARK